MAVICMAVFYVTIGNYYDISTKHKPRRMKL